MKKISTHLNFKKSISFFMIASGFSLLQACSSGGGGGTTPEAVITRVSVDSNEIEATGCSGRAKLSSDGRFVVFDSDAINLIANNTNATGDVFIRDVQSGETTRISEASDGTEADWVSFNVSISDDGRYIAFKSKATNLVADDTNNFDDIFLHDRNTAETIIISRGVSGESDGDSDQPSISADGRYIVFSSFASNLVAGDTNASRDVFIYDTQAVATKITRVSVTSAAAEANGNSFNNDPSISADGRFIVFSSQSTNLDSIATDNNGVTDVFLHDRNTGSTIRINNGIGAETDQNSGAPSISDDGKFIVYTSRATNLVVDDTNATQDIFIYDRVNITTSRVSISTDGSEGNDFSSSPSIDGNGQFIAFQSSASNLVDNDTNGFDDAYVRDRLNNQTYRVSIAIDGTESLDDSFDPALSSDGEYIAFESDAANLVSSDTNNSCDVFRVKNKSR